MRSIHMSLFGVILLITSLITGMGATSPSCDSSGGPTPDPSATPTSSPIVQGLFKKVFIVVLENENGSSALKQPYLKSLAARGAYFKRFFAEARPSQPNYIAMTAGDTYGVNTNNNVNLDVRHIADLIEEKGLTWKSYVEGYPGNCFKGATSGKYARKHSPFISYKNIQNNPERCAKLVNSNQLDEDVKNGTLPDYSFYVPDMDNSGHDTSISFASEWVKKRFDQYLSDPSFMKDMLFILTFDEASILSSSSIYTVFYGDSVVPGSTSEARYDHYNMLKTIEEGFGLGDLGQNDKTASVIEGVWK